MSKKIQIRKIHAGMTAQECEAEYEKIRTLKLSPFEWRKLNITIKTGVVPSDEEVEASIQCDHEASAGMTDAQLAAAYGLLCDPRYAHLGWAELCAIVRDRRPDPPKRLVTLGLKDPDGLDYDDTGQPIPGSDGGSPR
jgi:hypothetical protein